MIRPFELPYNFDMRLIDFMDIYFENRKEDIYSIYFPPYRADYLAAKAFIPSARTNTALISTYPNSRNEYIEHIKYIQKYFPNQLMLLLQHPTEIIPKEALEWYITTFGIKKFCVGNIEQAKEIKKYNSNFEITGSITMKIDKEKLESNPEGYKYFDSFVLWFPFNRDIDAIISLPQNYKYVLFVNGGCSILCDGSSHWYAKNYEEDQKKLLTCPAVNGMTTPETSIIIRPMDLQFFAPYISYFKLQGREWDTQEIIKHIVMYDIDFEKQFPFINYCPDLYKK